MGKRITMNEAIKATGLTRYALTQGIQQGKYPYIKVGKHGKGKILFDLELLEQYLKQEAIENMEAQKNASEYPSATETFYIGKLQKNKKQGIIRPVHG